MKRVAVWRWLPQSMINAVRGMGVEDIVLCIVCIGVSGC